MLSIHHWDAATQTCTACPADKLPASVAAVRPEDVWWIDLS